MASERDTLAHRWHNAGPTSLTLALDCDNGRSGIVISLMVTFTAWLGTMALL